MLMADRCKTTVKSKMELFVTIVNIFQLLPLPESLHLQVVNYCKKRRFPVKLDIPICSAALVKK